MVNSLFRRFIKILYLICSSFFPEFQVFSRLYHREAPCNHCKAALCLLNSSFFRHPFITEVFHGGSTWWFSKDLIPSRSAHQDSFQRSSSILNMAFRSAIPSTLCFQVVLCHFDSFPSCFMINKLFEMTYFKSIIFNSFVRSFATHQSLHWSYLGLYFT